ncbi:hypothetical protein [Cellulomonas fimi]|uniref:Uncharacterized protein n=1 Tax=Cellulomonas fimi TaxID=1708 RepID=A0A7Y0M0L3_CELFI|nr:hypothetical protein [Cellulomonas fimi]NMR21638.1 hypothetical protein [Cellulomonas fimi]
MARPTTHDELLLGGRLLPLTRTIVFVEREAEAFVEMFMGWRGARITERTGCAPVVSTIEGSLEDALHALLPVVTAMSSKYLVVPTVNGWSAFIENLWTGTEGNLMAGAMATHGMRAASISEAPHTYRASTNLGWWGQRTVTVAVPDRDQPHGQSAWTVGVRTTDSGRWEVAEPATAPPFPDPTERSVRKVADRFTHEHLLQVAAWFGLRPTDVSTTREN